MSLDVTELDMTRADTHGKIYDLLCHAFGTFPDELLHHVSNQPPKGQVSYGIYDKSKLVAVNFYIAHSVHQNGQTGTAYQSCTTATHRDYKGMKLFPKVMNFAKEDLTQKGGAFIFGFPNHISGPIAVNRLGFTLSDNISSFTFQTPLGAVGGYDEKALSQHLTADKAILFDYREAALWKQARHGDDLFQYESLTNYLFGRVLRKTAFGMRFNLLVVGGLEINKPYQTNAFIRKALRAAGCSAMRVTSNINGALAKSARITKGRTRTEPVIAFGLNWDVDAAALEVIAGLKDVY